MKGNHSISLINACIYIPIFYLERKEKYYSKTSKRFMNTLRMYFTHREHHEIWRRALRFRTCVKNIESLDVVTTADQNEGKCITKSRGQLATSAGTTCSAGKRETQSCDGFQFCIWLVDSVSRIFYTNQKAKLYKTSTVQSSCTLLPATHRFLLFAYTVSINQGCS